MASAPSSPPLISPRQAVHGVERPRCPPPAQVCCRQMRRECVPSDELTAVSLLHFYRPSLVFWCNTEVLKPGSVLGDFDAFPKSPPPKRNARQTDRKRVQNRLRVPAPLGRRIRIGNGERGRMNFKAWQKIKLSRGENGEEQLIDTKIKCKPSG